ncbi:tRNA preQ1(34) S-adenosylmethionine ribosyltransferase-isomerase QueA [Leptospira sp. GIMC2001]|uniref:tRNA preQ1(34) S-adenosylmethionine ribosyltransferase-isomerase QueA n=1 Tax=Leptospira sp. GIMC2001 TaxID=1513297 RepID=UPI00234B6505|nr:tRNA preQ1(34) S-adenosylmethionine ribosyltransferase-isomerase QueA [Leptospira sp. GIMC2001]WCL47632.1 tRNA preQ1(34) S-adenosylmethionine ribosyltransferase-isomerase QueA [Leptospira sp. GIMC2001]
MPLDNIGYLFQAFLVINLEDFDFPLSDDRIAKYPAKNRDESKLMVVQRKSGKITISPHFRNIADWLYPSDHIFYNETRVSKRRVYLETKNQDRIHETIFIESRDSQYWNCLVRNSKKLKLGDILFSPVQKLEFIVFEKREKDIVLKSNITILEEFFDQEGNIPIPPYLKRKSEPIDDIRYQSIFSEGKAANSIAAPTASLHMSYELRKNLIEKGIQFHPLHLEIGFGTFQPIYDEDIIKKKLHKEKIFISPDTAIAHSLASENKERRIALGTTTLRSLEAMYRTSLDIRSGWEGETDIFLTPDDTIDTIDGLITNFHLPKSSLLLLVSAFAGSELIMESYKLAIENDFTFFSYGDAMLIVD